MDSQERLLREAMENIATEFSRMSDDFTEDMTDAYQKMSREERKEMRMSHEEQMRQMEQVLDSFEEMIDSMSDGLSDFDKLFYKTLVANRRRDFKNLNKRIDKSFDALDDSLKEFAKSGESTLDKLSSKLSDISNIVTALDIGDIKDGVKEDGESAVDHLKQIRKDLNLTKDEAKNLRDTLDNNLKDLNKKYGDKFSRDDIYGAVQEVISEGGVRDQKLAEEIGVEFAKFSKSFDAGIEEFKPFVEVAQTKGLGVRYVDDAQDMIKQLSATMEVSSSDLIEQLGQFMPDLERKSGGDLTKMDNMTKQLLSAVSMFEDSFIDSGSMMDKFKEIEKATPQDLAQMGGNGMLDMQGIQKSLQNGDYDAVAEYMMNQMSSSFKGLDPTSQKYSDMMNFWSNFYDVDSTQMTKILKKAQSGGEEGIRDLRKQALEATVKGMEEGANEKALKDVHTEGFMERMKNKFSSTWLGGMVTDFMDSTDLGFDDVLKGYGAFTVGKAGLGKLMSFFGKGAATEAGASAGGSLLGNLASKIPGIGKFFSGATEAGASAGGSSLLSGLGSTVAGGLGSIAGGLGSTAVGGTAVAVGGGAVAGGFAGIAGLIDSIGDFIDASKEQDNDKAEEKIWQGGTKLGMVGGGALAGAGIGSVVPVVGTAVGGLIGAGVGGLSAIFGGDGVGSWLKDTKDSIVSWWDGIWSDNSEMNKPVVDTYEKATDEMSKMNKDLQKSVKKENKKQDSGFVWYKPWTWFGDDKSNNDSFQADGSHKNGLDSVPFDGYKAILHKDEAVLTKEQADNWRKEQNMGNTQGLIDKLRSMMSEASKNSASYAQSLGIGGSLLDSNGNIAPPQGATVGNGDIPSSVWQSLRNMGYSKATTAGIMGNMKQESQVDPTLIQGNGRGPAAGIVQWENYNTKSGRFKSMSDYAASKGKQWTDLQSQLEWMDMELQGKDSTTKYLLGKKVGGYEKFKQLNDVNTATRVFEESFERAGIPRMENRYKAANEFYKQFNAYKQGTPWVPNDQIALIHQDEMVVPKSHNPLANDSVSIPLVGSKNSELITLLKWGFDYLGKKIEESKSVVEVSGDKPRERESKSDPIFQF